MTLSEITDRLDEIAGREHYDDETAEDCTVCTLVAAVRAVLALADSEIAEPWDQHTERLAHRIRSAIADAVNAAKQKGRR